MKSNSNDLYISTYIIYMLQEESFCSIAGRYMTALSYCSCPESTQSPFLARKMRRMGAGRSLGCPEDFTGSKPPNPIPIVRLSFTEYWCNAENALLGQHCSYRAWDPLFVIYSSAPKLKSESTAPRHNA